MTATASNSSAAAAVDSTKANDLPPMAPHSWIEFAFAERNLKQMVDGSKSFPEEAAQADWFQPREAAADEKNARRPSADSADSTAASTVSTTPWSPLPSSPDKAYEKYSSFIGLLGLKPK